MDPAHAQPVSHKLRHAPMPRIVDPDEDGYRFRRAILLKQWRMVAKRWLVLKGPLRRWMRAP